MLRPGKKPRSEAHPKPGSGSPHAPLQSKAPPPDRRKWLFRTLLLVSPALLLLFVEAGLRVCGSGYPTSFFLKKQINGQTLLEPNDKFGWRFFGPTLARTPRPGMFAATKPADTWRVFVFGESAAFGDPNPDFGLPRLLQVLLRARFPQSKIEVINVAMTGINSHVLLPIARDCAPNQGDVWVIYMGNNEVVGPFGSGTVFGPQAPPLALIRANIALKSTRTAQLLASLFHPARPQSEEWGMALFQKNQVRQGEPRLQRAYANFRSNLEDMLRLGTRHGAQIVLSTVLSNLKDCPPFASAHRPDLSSAQLQQWQKWFQDGCAAQGAQQFSQAATNFAGAAQIDPAFAELQYRWGQCLLASQQPEQAKAHFVLARDADTLRFRADTQLNQIIRSTGANFSNRGVTLVDADALLSRDCTNGIAGNEFLYEHVHFNFEGNYRLASAIGEAVAQLWSANPVSNAPATNRWLTSAECAHQLGYTDAEQYKTLKIVWLRFNEPPFDTLFDHPQRCRRLQQQMEALLPGLRPAALHENLTQYQQAVALSPDDWVLQKNYGELLQGLGDLTGAENCYRKLQQLLPDDPLPHLQLGLLLIQDGKLDAACAEFTQGLRLKPDSVALLNGLGLAQLRSKQPDAALATYQQALALSPRSTETELNLANALESLGRRDAAQAHYQRAVALGSSNSETALRIGRAALAKGWASDAVTNLAKAVQLNPTDASAHFYLGGAFDALHQVEQARAELAEAVRLQPDHARARVALGVELRKEGQDAAALEQFAEAARLQPDLLEARLNLGIALARQNKREEARRELQEALRLQPANMLALQWLNRLQNE